MRRSEGASSGCTRLRCRTRTRQRLLPFTKGRETSGNPTAQDDRRWPTDAQARRDYVSDRQRTRRRHSACHRRRDPRRYGIYQNADEARSGAQRRRERGRRAIAQASTRDQAGRGHPLRWEYLSALPGCEATRFMVDGIAAHGLIGEHGRVGIMAVNPDTNCRPRSTVSPEPRPGPLGPPLFRPRAGWSRSFLSDLVRNRTRGRNHRRIVHHHLRFRRYPPKSWHSEQRPAIDHLAA